MRGIDDSFADVDASNDPDALIGYLSSVNRSAGTAAYKERSFQLLGIAEGQRVLDVGCGLGDDLRRPGMMVGRGGVAVGVDRSTRMIRAATGQLPPGSGAIVAGDALRLPFTDGVFDGVRCDRLLQHLPDPAAAIAEMSRVSRRPGRLVVVAGDYQTFTTSAHTYAGRAILEAQRDAHASPHVGSEFRLLFARCGVEVDAVEPFTYMFDQFEAADQVLSLCDAARAAVEAGCVTRAQAAIWLSALQHQSERGEFFASLTLFLAAGTTK